MWNDKTIVACIVVFVLTGVLAYLATTIYFRHSGRIGRYEGLWEYYRKIDQKNGNMAVIVFGVIWVVLMALSGIIIYAVN